MEFKIPKKPDEIMKSVSIGVLALWGVYVVLVRGVVGLLISASIGLIIASFEKRLEIIAAGTIIISFIVIQALRTFRIMEFYTNGGTAGEIAQRLAKIDAEGGVLVKNPRNAVNGAPANTTRPLTYDSAGTVEGFEDGSGNTVPDSASAPAKQSVNEVASDIEQKVKKAVAAASGGSITAASQTPSNPSPTTSESFKSEPSGLFKLGEIPTESRDGPMIDAGSTFMKAISALDEKQIKSMSEDTSKMVDAQKNLIGLLNTMKPIIQDGSRLLTSFSGILGQQGGDSANLLKLGQLGAGK